MKSPDEKSMTAASTRAYRDQLEAEGKQLALTNGSFDILHRGHVAYLQCAREQGDALCIGLNSDEYVKRNKGENRPDSSGSRSGVCFGRVGRCGLCGSF